jgi:lipopolysaccharide export system protein LptA
MNNKIKSILRIAFAAALFAVLCVGNLYAQTSIDYNISNGSINLTNGNMYVIRGSSSSTTNTITVAKDAKVVVLLDNVSIDVSNKPSTCAFLINENAEVSLAFEGTNVLKSGSGSAGIHVSMNATLKIEDLSVGTGSGCKLTVVGGSNSAGIGGSDNHMVGTIIIDHKESEIEASTTGYGAGIGGGKYCPYVAGIVINSGRVTAKGFYARASVVAKVRTIKRLP